MSAPGSHDDVEAVLAVLVEDARVDDLRNTRVRSYRCPNCQEWCLNPVGSAVEKANICVHCHASYLATGSTAGRINRRTAGDDR